ncbi:hypothetical protein L9G74_20715 [Shewanella sp. C32]|uniref:Uncharacterized protein n=1 Tax=Shewanella electrica TaxID=515560 RepID=A0ABT2FR62_9GAMM|nr:hypothetical protein [Shewanella electrica]MCS4558843.1 hypothetical protein [Shewanella electrica]
MSDKVFIFDTTSEPCKKTGIGERQADAEQRVSVKHLQKYGSGKLTRVAANGQFSAGEGAAICCNCSVNM